MWTMYYYIQGFLLGLASMAPIGMQNIFLINTALTQRIYRIVQTVLIVTAFDLSLSLSAFFGIGWLLDAVPWAKLILLLGGGALVVVMGVALLRARGQLEGADVDIPLTKIIAMAGLVTWCNPQAILDTSMMLGAVRASIGPAEADYFVGGFATATIVWFVGLASIVRSVASYINSTVLTCVNRLCGTFIVVYGAYLLWKGIELLSI